MRRQAAVRDGPYRGVTWGGVGWSGLEWIHTSHYAAVSVFTRVVLRSGCACAPPLAVIKTCT